MFSSLRAFRPYCFAEERQIRVKFTHEQEQLWLCCKGYYFAITSINKGITAQRNRLIYLQYRKAYISSGSALFDMPNQC